MSRIRKAPLRELTSEELTDLRHIGSSHADAAARVAHAKEILKVHAGATYAEAARSAGRHSRHMVSALVARFNCEGLDALTPRHAGGRESQYGTAEKEKILAEWQRAPDRRKDGTATWSIDTLKRSLRASGYPALAHVSHDTIWTILHDAGLTWQRDRSWAKTGTAWRIRQGQAVEVTDPDTAAKKN